MSRCRSSFLWKHSAICRILCLCFLLFNLLFCIYYCSFSLIHCSHCFTCKIWRRFVIVQRTYCWCLVSTRSNSSIVFFFYLFAFRLRPWNSSGFSNSNIGIVLSRSYFISFFSFKILNRWFIKFKFIIFILVITISMNIRRNWRNRLILIDVDKMLKNFRFCCCIRCTNCFRSNFNTFVIAK